MKTVPYQRNRGNVKMRGLKHCVLSCRCCDIENTLEERLLKAIKIEIEQELDGAAKKADSFKYFDMYNDLENATVANDEYYATEYMNNAG